jgi:amidohydrolase
MRVGRGCAIVFIVLIGCCVLWAGDRSSDFSISDAEVNTIYPEVEKTYLDLHQNPELSKHETRTAAKMAQGLRGLGYEVTTGVGGTGVVGILRNGNGPVVMIRTDMDALPMEEKTGLQYASHIRTQNDAGAEVGVMHACGHDIHMATWLGTAQLMASNKSHWSGTLMMVGQPAEEIVSGAKAMLEDGLFTRFPKPSCVLGLHDAWDLPTGKIKYTSGFALTSADSVDITIYGKGGHGAQPQNTIDPIIIATRTIMTLQTLVSRENDPRELAIVTVGSIHGGTKHNIIPDEVKLQLTVRSLNPDVRKHLLAGIERIARAEAMAAGAEKAPQVKVVESTNAVYNDPDLTRKVMVAERQRLGEANVVEAPVMLGSEDFSEYGQAGIPAVYFLVGAVEPGKYATAKASASALPTVHSSLFAPEREGTLKTAIVAETTAALCVLGSR